MDSLVTSAASSAKPQGLAGLLSSLDSAIGSSADPAIFARFLEQNNSAPPPPPPSDNANASAQNTVSQQTPVDNPPVGGGGHGGGGSSLLKKVVTTLHRVIEQLKSKTTNKAPQAKQADDTNAQPDDAATAQTQNNQTPVTAATGDTTGTDDAADASSPADPSAASLTPAQLLADLILLMQTIEKKLEAGQDPATPASTDSTSTSATGPTAQTPAANANGLNPALDNLLAQASVASGSQTAPATPADPADTGNTDTAGQTNAADPLAQLLALIQSLEKKLDAPANDLSQTQNSATAGPVANSASLPPATDDLSGIHKDLKALLALLKDAAANNNAPGDAGTAGASTTTANNAPIAGLLKTSDPAPANKSASQPATDFLNTFAAKTDMGFGDFSTTNGFAAMDPNVLTPDTSANGKNDASLDWTGKDGGSASDLQTAAALKTDTTQVPEGITATSPYSFASQLSDIRAVSGGTTGLPSAVEQVLLQLNRGVKDGNDQMTIQLHPADLGKISIKLDISGDNKVQGTVVADNPATLNLLLKDVRSLERALQEAGLRADPGSLQFSLSGQSGNPGQTAGDFGAGSPGTNTSFNAADASSDASADVDETWVLTPGRVNFKV